MDDIDYVQRLSTKINKRHITAFVRPKAETRFLGPLGLTLKSTPPLNFGNDKTLFKREEEFTFFTALHYMKYKLSKVKRKDVRKRYVAIYMAMRNRCVSANNPLIYNCVKRHSQRLAPNVDVAQFIERGFITLIGCVDGFDPWRGYRFCTYACNAISKSFFNRSRPTVSAVPLEEVVEEVVQKEEFDENQDLYIERMKIYMRSDELTDRQKQILQYRFHQQLKLGEVGEIIGLTKERVRQIQIETLSKMREQLIKDPVLA